MHQPQKKCRVAPCSPPTTGSPSVTAKPSAGIAAESEKALELIRWQPVQWQAMVTSGGAVTRIRTRPQRHPPSHGSRQSCAPSAPVMVDSPYGPAGRAILR
jgi:hypothetical protein